MSLYFVEPNHEGVYFFGPQKSYALDSIIEHIVFGDFILKTDQR